MNIRDAKRADLKAMTDVRAASIRALCQSDHGDNDKAIADWIGNDDKFEQLLADKDATIVVVELDEQVAGVGAMAGDRVTLNYVHPDFRFQGVSKAIMQTLESRMVAQGILIGYLDSSKTAHRFYKAIAWSDAGPETARGAQPMRKDLL